MHLKQFEFVFSSFLIMAFCACIYYCLPNAQAIWVVGLVAVALNGAWFFSSRSLSFALEQGIRYRYGIALVLFIVCVLLRLHGSSLGIYAMVWPDAKTNGLLFGVSRAIRSDEFNVQLPYYFSQYYNHYKEISHQMSVAGQDMILGYNAPVWDLTLIGKPFTWGYLLFGNEVGLSWYWCSKILLFVLMSFEMLKILVRHEKAALLGALVIVFSPSLQWWFSPHMYDVFFWATTIFVSGYYFVMAHTRRQKLLMVVTSIASLAGFVIALFPSIQIPAGMLVLALFAACVWRDRAHMDWTKADWLRCVCVVGGVFLILGHFWLQAKDQIHLLYCTVYPGKRMVLGGNNAWTDLFTDLRVFLLPYRDPRVLNASELSTFIHLGPLCMAYFPYVYIRLKGKSDQLLIGWVLVMACLIEAWFMVTGFPAGLAKLTLFSYCNRMKIVYGFTATVLTIWMAVILVHHADRLNKKVTALYGAGFFAVVLGLVPSMTDLTMVRSYGVVFYAMALFVGSLAVLFLFQRKYLLAVSVLCTVVLTGCTINPVVQGTSALDDHQIVRFLKSHPALKKGNWIATESLLNQNFLLAQGMKTLNAVNFYPDYGKWKALDIDGTYDDVYNRYAHIEMSIKQKTHFKVKRPDLIEVQMAAKDLKKWDVTYILSQQDYKGIFTKYGIKYKIIYKDRNGAMIYQLIQGGN